MSDKKNLHVLVSECCREACEPIPVVIVEIDTGVAHYRHMCNFCKQPCHTMDSEIYDSDGIEIEPGDVIEGISHSNDGKLTESTWHVAFLERDWLTIRDLNANNVGMYLTCDSYHNRGKFWNHLDKLSADDLLYYWKIGKGR